MVINHIHHFSSLHAEMTTVVSDYARDVLFFIFLPVLLLQLLKGFLRKSRQVQKLSGGHRPPSYPIIGCLISFYKNRRRLLDWYTELLAESATSTIVVHRLGARKTIVTANPENVEYILKTNFNNFPKGKPFTEILGDFLGCGIFNVDGELWSAQRKLASHEFTAKSVREFFMITLEKEVNGLLPLLETLAEKGEVVDLQELLKRVAFNMVLTVSLGIDRCQLYSSPPSPLARAFDTASAICAGRGAAPVFMVWKIKRWLGVGSERRLRDAIEEIHQHVADIISKKRRTIEEEGEDQSNDLLSRLLSAGHEERVIRDMVISFIMAGRDTTSAAMTWLFWLLSCHPDIEQEVVDETKTVMEKISDYDSLRELKLLKACIYESMRLYPPVAWDSKHATADDMLPDNTLVQAGDRVTYFPYGMGRMEALWGKDWDKFKPNRWFEQNKKGELRKVCPFTFPIFQAGPRVCLGKEIACTQMKYVVASILHRFELKPISSASPVFVPLLTAHMAGGLKVLVQKRRTQMSPKDSLN